MKKKPKILVIDDEEILCESIKIILERSKYEVLVAHDGLEGLDKAIKEKPDLILLDILMPGLNGYEVLAKLKEKLDRYTPIIMFTVKGDVQSIYDAEFLQATDYIIKPFKLRELLKLVKKYTDIYS